MIATNILPKKISYLAVIIKIIKNYILTFINYFFIWNYIIFHRINLCMYVLENVEKFIFFNNIILLTVLDKIFYFKLQSF